MHAKFLFVLATAALPVVPGSLQAQNPPAITENQAFFEGVITAADPNKDEYIVTQSEPGAEIRKFEIPDDTVVTKFDGEAVTITDLKVGTSVRLVMWSEDSVQAQRVEILRPLSVRKYTEEL